MDLFDVLLHAAEVDAVLVLRVDESKELLPRRRHCGLCEAVAR